MYLPVIPLLLVRKNQNPVYTPLYIRTVCFVVKHPYIIVTIPNLLPC